MRILMLNNEATGGTAEGYGYAIYNYYLAESYLFNNIADGGESLNDVYTYGLYQYSYNYSPDYTVISNNYFHGGDAGTGISNGACLYQYLGQLYFINNIVDAGTSDDPVATYIYTDYALSDTRLHNNNLYGPSNLECLLLDYNDLCVTEIAGVNACAWTGCAGASGNVSEDPSFVNKKPGRTGNPALRQTFSARLSRKPLHGLRKRPLRIRHESGNLLFACCRELRSEARQGFLVLSR